ncbi:uncharacterized protein [Hemitrygon akajei]|uniref:uncharacterized protein n=1 Tax=Hemitrygon akajei TaxID=2704970 RepID=UPI003BF9712E
MDVQEFRRNPTVEALWKATKSDLVSLAQALDLTAVKPAMKKQEVRRVIQQHYVGKKVFAAEDLENIPERRLVSGTNQAELEKARLEHEFKIKQLEVEAAQKAAEREAERAEREKEAERAEREKEAEREAERAEREAERAEREAERAEREKERAAKERAVEREQVFKLKQLEAEEKEKQRNHELELDRRKQERRTQGGEREEGFDISRALRLVPPFEETDVDSYFLLFEKVAGNQQWPREQWVALLQSVLRGKAQRVYAALPTERDGNYDQVKEAILRGYELVPEAYRQRFRNLKRGWNQTYTELAHEKGVLLDR